MRSTVVWSFLSLVALAAGGLVSACDNDATVVKSAEGESCDRTADCNEGLKCLQGTCYEVAPGGGEGGDNSGSGGSVTGPPAPVLGGEGETCTKRADCEDMLACFNGRCTMATGEGGGGNNPIRLGQLGETCTVSSDCDPALACLPGGQFQGGLPLGNLGVCTNPSRDLVPSGKSCGAECVEDADCCELPVAVHAAYDAILAPYGTGANSCAELAELIGVANCAGVLTPAQAARCFAQDAYCSCDATWTCEAGQCNYTADCTENGATPGGCPHFSRSSIRPLSPACDAASDKCQPPAVDAVCETDADCDGLTTADTLELCAADECVCFEQTGCYRACDGELDCKPGFTCDTADHVCKPVPSCTSDAECVGRLGGRFACVDETCQQTCASNFDCNGGAVAGPATLICNPLRVCEALGCTSNEQCTNGAVVNPVKMFCTDNPAAAVGGVSSAITD